MPDATHPLVAAMALNQPMVADILATHLRDDHGRCAGCAVDDRLRPVWPCGVRGVAVLAQRGDVRRAG